MAKRHKVEVFWVETLLCKGWVKARNIVYLQSQLSKHGIPCVSSIDRGVHASSSGIQSRTLAQFLAEYKEAEDKRDKVPVTKTMIGKLERVVKRLKEELQGFQADREATLKEADKSERQESIADRLLYELHRIRDERDGVEPGDETEVEEWLECYSFDRNDDAENAYQDITGFELDIEDAELNLAAHQEMLKKMRARYKKRRPVRAERVR